MLNQDALTSRSVNLSSSVVQSSQEDVLRTDTKHLAIVNDHFKAQSLKSSMDHLNKEVRTGRKARMWFILLGYPVSLEDD